MSHFTVLVINTDGSQEIESKLAPFQENNMGDCPKEFMEFHDLTEEVEDEWENGQLDQIKVGDKWFFSHEQRHAYPDAEERKKVTVQRPVKEVYATIEEYANDYHGYEKDEETGFFGYHHNPNAKWDWYEVGGRWAGSLKIKHEFKDDYPTSKLGFSWGWTEIQKLALKSQLVADAALAKHIDWEAYHNSEDADKYMRFWELVVEGQKPQNEEEEKSVKWNFYKPEYFLEKYSDKATYARCMCSFTSYAVLKDGKWISAGEMGWFGMSSETPEEGKNFELSFYNNFIKDLPENAFLCVVDCHI